MLNFNPVHGTWVNCFGTISPWGTPLTSEELYIGGGDEFRQNIEMMNRWFDNNHNPLAEKIVGKDVYTLITPGRVIMPKLAKNDLPYTTLGYTNGLWITQMTYWNRLKRRKNNQFYTK